MYNCALRKATEEDVPTMLGFIKALAAYENMADCVTATEDLLREWIFERKIAEVIFVTEDGKEVGFALFFHNYSTFLAKGGIFLEDLFVLPEYRGRGYGKGCCCKDDLAAADTKFPHPRSPSVPKMKPVSLRQVASALRSSAEAISCSGKASWSLGSTGVPSTRTS